MSHTQIMGTNVNQKQDAIICANIIYINNSNCCNQPMPNSNKNVVNDCV